MPRLTATDFDWPITIAAIMWILGTFVMAGGLGWALWLVAFWDECDGCAPELPYIAGGVTASISTALALLLFAGGLIIRRLRSDRLRRRSAGGPHGL